MCCMTEKEAITWEIEQRHLHERYQLHKRLLKDFYFLRRHQMLTRHEKVRPVVLVGETGGAGR